MFNTFAPGMTSAKGCGAPAIEYRYTWNDSNIAFYEYDSHTVDIRLTKDF